MPTTAIFIIGGEPSSGMTKMSSMSVPRGAATDIGTELGNTCLDDTESMRVKAEESQVGDHGDTKLRKQILDGEGMRCRLQSLKALRPRQHRLVHRLILLQNGLYEYLRVLYTMNGIGKVEMGSALTGGQVAQRSPQGD